MIITLSLTIIVSLCVLFYVVRMVFNKKYYKYDGLIDDCYKQITELRNHVKELHNCFGKKGPRPDGRYEYEVEIDGLNKKVDVYREYRQRISV